MSIHERPIPDRPIHDLPIGERIDWLFAMADRHGEAFRSAEAWIARERYSAQHPTAIIVLKCMDGRINIPFATNTPVGVLRPFRNLGGMFDLGWPHLGEVLAHDVRRMVHAGRRVLIIITYHFSKGDPRRGCAGFDFDTRASIDYVRGIQRQVEHIFGSGHATVYPLVCGFETDTDALIVHGTNGETLDMSAVGAGERAALDRRLTALLPDMPAQMRADLQALLDGNIDHIEQMRHDARALDIEHREWTICLGRGFEFLHTPNLALIIGPYSPNLDEPIGKAAGIIQANMAAGRIPDDGFLLLSAAPFDEFGVDRARAELKARFLSQFATEVISAAYPELARKMAVRTAVLDWHSRQLTVVGNG